VVRCTFYRLQESARLFNVFVCAERRYRIQRMLRVCRATDPESAAQMIDHTDNDRRNYHLTINVSRIGPEATEEMVLTTAMRLRDKADDVPLPRTWDHMEGRV
jgi:hypothetical protein